MASDEITRIRALQLALNALQHQLNDVLLGQATTGRKLTLDDLEIRVSKLTDAVLRRPARASRRPV